MSYGKVDHYRYAFLVALAVLPTVGVARWRDHRRSEAAGFALVLFLLGFHLTVFTGVGIIFFPHVVATLSILPWERLTARRSSPDVIPRASADVIPRVDDQAVVTS